jgi:hypothetical protein
LNYSNYYNLYTSYNGFLFNLSYLNWIVILLIIGFIYISWRTSYNNYIILDNFIRLTLFSIFFFFNYQFVL